MAVTNTPDKSEMKALERVERRLNNTWAKHGFMTLTVSDLREVVSLARAPSRPADQVPDMVERVARAICDSRYPYDPRWPILPESVREHWRDYARAAIAALQAVPAASEVGKVITKACDPRFSHEHIGMLLRAALKASGEE
jgi:hypothetical protein